MLWGSGSNIELFNYILRHENASLPEKGTFVSPLQCSSFLVTATISSCALCFSDHITVRCHLLLIRNIPDKTHQTHEVDEASNQCGHDDKAIKISLQ